MTTETRTKSLQEAHRGGEARQEGLPSVAQQGEAMSRAGLRKLPDGTVAIELAEAGDDPALDAVSARDKAWFETHPDRTYRLRPMSSAERSAWAVESEDAIARPSGFENRDFFWWVAVRKFDECNRARWPVLVDVSYLCGDAPEEKARRAFDGAVGNYGSRSSHFYF
jgi:hypothetical protein